MLCGLGCNILPGERNGTLRRVRNRYHGEINRYFLCDRGRFGYEFVNSSSRIRNPEIRGSEGSRTISADEAIDHVAALLDRGGAIGIGSPKASLEANHALRRLVGAERFFMGIGTEEAAALRMAVEIIREGRARTPTLREVEESDAILILGEDPTNTAPLLDLAIRQALLNQPKKRVHDLDIPEWNDALVRLVVDGVSGPLFIATPGPTPLDELATRAVRAAPQDIAQLGYAIAAYIEPSAPGAGRLTYNIARQVGKAADALRRAEAPLIVAGTGSGHPAILRAAANVVRALGRTNPATALSLVVPDCNSVGAALLEAGDLARAADATASGGIETAIVLEPDIARRGRGSALTTVLDSVRHVVVLDQLAGPVSERAEIVLPAATFAECGGTVVNNEGRAQRFFQVFVPGNEIRASWRWLGQVHERVHGPGTAPWSGSDDVAEALAEEQPVFGPITGLVPSPTGEPGRKIPRQSHRVTGRTAVDAHLRIREPRPPDDPESPLAFSMEGDSRHPPAGLITRYWSPGWNSVQSLTRFQEEIGGPLRGGDTGARLVDSAPADDHRYFDGAPEAFEPRSGKWLVVSLYHLFGSERLSLETPGVSEQAPEPYVALNPGDGERLGVEAGAILTVEIDGRAVDLPFKPEDGIPVGCAGLPDGPPSLQALPDGKWATIRGSS
jgi:NADH-quinone oxidoreductase subunit G